MALTTPKIGIKRANRPIDHYTPIANSFARSKLKPRAKVVALYLLSHTEGFVATQARIAREIGIGVSTVSDALEDLEQAGLLQRRTVHGEGGHIVGTEYVVSDTPLIVESNDGPDDLIVESLDRENLDRDSKEPKKINSSEKTNHEENTTAPQGSDAAPDAEPEFSAKDVVAAYVDSFRLKSGGQDPVGRFIGQVGREAKKLISEGRSSELLLRAADQLGKTPYASLENQVARLMTNTTAGVQTGRTEAYQPGLDSRRNEENWQRLYAEDPSRFSVADPSLDDDEPAF